MENEVRLVFRYGRHAVEALGTATGTDAVIPYYRGKIFSLRRRDGSADNQDGRSIMRTIVSETDSQQIQSDENGFEYIFRKDFIADGDFKKEFSLSLVYSRPGRVKPEVSVEG